MLRAEVVQNPGFPSLRVCSACVREPAAGGFVLGCTAYAPTGGVVLSLFGQQ